MLKILGIFFSLSLLSACAGMEMPKGGAPATSPSGPATLNADKYVGVVAAQQSREVDDDVAGRNETAYFFPVYTGIQEGRPGFEGVSGDTVFLTVRSGPNVYWSEQVTLDQNGVGKAVLPVGTPLSVTSALCVETAWPIAHQRTRPAFADPSQHVACTEDGALSRYLRTENRGNSSDDAYGVIAIKARG